MNNMQLKDILGNEEILIMYRINPPDVFYPSRENSILLGYCKWTASGLISLDGDFYSIEDFICDYEYYEDFEGQKCLCVYQYAKWS